MSTLIEFLFGFLGGAIVGLIPGVVVMFRNRVARRELVRRWERDRDYLNRTAVYNPGRTLR